MLFSYRIEGGRGRHNDRQVRPNRLAGKDFLAEKKDVRNPALS